MNSQTVSLDDLAQRISELKSLQREYHSRQRKVAVLKRRARKLENKLKQVRGQIDELTKGSEETAAPERAPRVKRRAAKLPAMKAATPKTSAPKLADLVVEIVREAGRPIMIQAIADEVKRRKFSTKSKNIRNLVSTVVTKLVARGMVRRTAGRKGIVLRQPKAASKPTSSEKPPGDSQNGAPAKTPTATPATRNGQPSLQSVLAGILGKSRRPLSAQELADQARAAGYKTKSKDFPHVIWTTLGKMDVERVPDKGFRLKR